MLNGHCTRHANAMSSSSSYSYAHSGERPKPAYSTIVLSLVNARGGVLLIDEFENGLHYSVQLDAWRMIFNLAQSLNVQVFATTHSWDAVESFQTAAAEAPGKMASFCASFAKVRKSIPLRLLKTNLKL